MVHLHTKSWYSFRRGGSSPDALVQQALENGQTAIALTDYMSTAGVIPFQVAARAKGIKSVEIYIFLLLSLCTIIKILFFMANFHFFARKSNLLAKFFQLMLLDRADLNELIIEI